MPSQDYNNSFRVPLRTYILDDLEINSLIDNRFYGAQLATLELTTNSFPLAVFYPDSGDNLNLGIIKKFIIVVRAYSDNHFDEAYEIHRAISERLGGQSGAKSIPNTGITIRPTSIPHETYESEPRIYGVGSRFLVHWIS